MTSSSAIESWNLPETNISSYFLLKILNRHHPDWCHGEDIRCLTKVPEAKWISEGKGFSTKIYSIKLTVKDKVYQFCVKVSFREKSRFKKRQLQIPSVFHWEANINNSQDEKKKARAHRVIAGIHARELAFYKISSAHFKNMLKIPKFFYGREWTKDHEGIIFMEDFTPQCDPIFLAQKPFTHIQILALIEQIAILQASSMGIEMIERDFRALDSAVESTAIYADMSIDIMLAKNLEFFNEEIAEKIRDLAIPGILKQILVRCDDLFPVLVHSAIWPGNVLWSSENPSDLLAIIDWQGCFAGSPTADLAALLAISTSAEQRQSREDEYLKHYIKKFDEHRDKEKTAALDFEIVKEAYGRSLLYSMIELIVFIVSNPGDDVIDEGETYGVMTRRLKALIEDLLLD